MASGADRPVRCPGTSAPGGGPRLALPWGATADAVATAAGAGVPITGALLHVAGGDGTPFAIALDAWVRRDRPGRGLRARGARPLWSARRALARAVPRAHAAGGRHRWSAWPSRSRGVTRPRPGGAGAPARRAVRCRLPGPDRRPAERIGVQVSTIHQAKGSSSTRCSSSGWSTRVCPGAIAASDIPDQLLPETIRAGATPTSPRNDAWRMSR